MYKGVRGTFGYDGALQFITDESALSFVNYLK